MAKPKRSPPPSPPLPRKPRNTVTLSLDGDDSTFIHNFGKCQAHLQYWLLCNSGFRVRYGDKLIYTTPLQGTFYYVIRYINRYIVWVIMARTAWLIGFLSEKGYFQVKSNEIEGLYMDSAFTKILPFNGNHKSISPQGIESNMINLGAIQRRFSELADYDGPIRHHDPPGFASHFGFFVVLLLESKCKITYQRHCKAIMGHIDFNREDDLVTYAVTNWSSISKQILWSFNDADHKPHDCGIRALKNFDQLLDVFYYLHVDAYFSGLFEHTPMEPAPRKLTWDPIDMGAGDGDIVIRQEPDSSTIRSRGDQKRKPKGLCGGGLGGRPEVPKVFLQWAYGAAKEDKIKCDALVSHLSLLGLNVLQVKRKLSTRELEPLGYG